MRYISLDFETTTATDKQPENALSLALVIEDMELSTSLDQLPTLKILFLHKPLTFDDVAVAMNPKAFAARALAKGHMKPEKLPVLVGQAIAEGAIKLAAEYIAVKSWVEAEVLIREFLMANSFGNDPIVLAGKNIKSFDWLFMPTSVQALFNGEFLDPGDIYKEAGDRYKPSMAECSRRAGISDFVSHDAADDARQVIALIRHKMK